MTNLNQAPPGAREPISESEFDRMLARQFMPARYKAAPHLEPAYLRRRSDPLGAGKLPLPVVVPLPDHAPLKQGLRDLERIIGWSMALALAVLAYAVFFH